MKKIKVHSLTGRITSRLMRQAFQAVKRNRGAAGVDRVSIKMFAANLEENLAALMRELKDGNVPAPAAAPRLHPQRPRHDEAPTARHSGGSRSDGSRSDSKASGPDLRASVSRAFLRVHSRTQLPPGGGAGVGSPPRRVPGGTRRGHPRVLRSRIVIPLLQTHLLSLSGLELLK